MKIKILSWNVQGLNRKNKRSTLKSLVHKWGIDILCLQETKIEDWSNSLISQIWGNRWVAWAELKAYDSKGGILIMWDKKNWNCVDSEVGNFSISCRFESLLEDFN